MTTHDDGGRAFPLSGYDGPSQAGGHITQMPMHGMSMRQWYAGLAMQGLLANSLALNSIAGDKAPTGFIERLSVSFADSLIAELKK